jgi:hypothetical protein
MRSFRALAAIGATLIAASPAYGQANERASCIGIGASSFAGSPRAVATITHQIHDAYKAMGLPPGHFEAEFARRHEGSFAACFPDF